MSFLQSTSMAQDVNLSICEVVRQAFALGCLTVEAEEQLRQLLRKKYGKPDFRAFMQLQYAVMSGTVRQESRDRFIQIHEQAEGRLRRERLDGDSRRNRSVEREQRAEDRN